jgi:hypothetical protein
MKRFPLGCCLVALFYLGTGGALANLPSVVAHDDGQASMLSASGSIAKVDRKSGRVFLACSRPFWAPGPNGSSRITLWPAEVLLTVAISGTAITIDGKKAGFDQLSEGQNAVVRYTLHLSMSGMYAGYVHCVARRVDVRTSELKRQEDKRKKVK